MPNIMCFHPKIPVIVEDHDYRSFCRATILAVGFADLAPSIAAGQYHHIATVEAENPKEASEMIGECFQTNKIVPGVTVHEKLVNVQGGMIFVSEDADGGSFYGMFGWETLTRNDVAYLMANTTVFMSADLEVRNAS